MNPQGEDNMITDTEIDTFVSTTLDLLTKFRQDLLETQVGLLVGKTIKITRNLKDPATGEYHEMVLDAVINGARWGFDDGIEFKVIYTHPFTGKKVETEQGA
jgi:hypothetical protein